MAQAENDLLLLKAKIDIAIGHLEWCCWFYCNWYDGTGAKISAGGAAYELVAGIRQALRALKEEKNEQ